MNVNKISTFPGKWSLSNFLSLTSISGDVAGKKSSITTTLKALVLGVKIPPAEPGSVAPPQCRGLPPHMRFANAVRCCLIEHKVSEAQSSPS